MRSLLLEGAQSDLEAIVADYEKKSKGLGDNFARELYRAIDVIVENPLSWRRIHKETRRALLRRFPFMIVYDIAEELVLIVAIIHQRRRPGAWRDHLKHPD